MISGSRSRREMLGLMGVAAGAAAAYPLLSALPAGASFDEPPTLPGQIGVATASTTLAGSAYWVANVYAGTGSDPHDDYHYARVLVPRSLDVTVATPTVLVVHGATALEDCVTRPGGMATLAQSWIDRGWAVIATREGSNVNALGKGINAKWGNQLSRRGMCDAWRWARTAWTPDPHGFLVLGFSMGGLAGLNFAAEAQRQHIPVGAVYSIDGAVNLFGCSNRSVAFHKQIKLAYALPNYVAGDANWTAKVDVADGGHDPMKFVAGLRSFPLRLAASNQDTTIKIAQNTMPLYSALLAAGWGAPLQLLTYRGGHCAAAHFKATDVNPFFVSALQRVNAAPVASFTFTTSDLTASFDGTGSGDADDFVVAHAWDLGDGTLGSGPVVGHTYAEPGSYVVTLTVTDEGGATGVATATVTVPEPPPDDPPPDDPPPDDPPPDE